MKAPEPELDPEWRALLGGRRVSRRAPPEMRARLLARGRALVGAGEPESPPNPAEMVPPVPHGNRALRVMAVAASVAVVAAAGAVGAVIAGRYQPPAAEPVVAPAPGPAAVPIAEGPVGTLPVPARPAAPIGRKHARAAQPGPDLFTAELELLQRAHAAYTRRIFPAALALIAEHARRFPHGRLAEEREALRVRSLAGAGRAEEAHRAAVAFAVQFPRSVLLQRSQLFDDDGQKALE